MKTQFTTRRFYLEGEIESGKVRITRREGDMEIKGYVTTKEAAERLRVSPGRVRQLIADGVLETVKVGATRLILIESLERHERTRRGRGKPPLIEEES